MLALLLLSILPLGPVADRVDIIEINHLHDEHGRLVFDQAIFWQWDGERHQIIAWRLVKHHSQFPQRDWSRGGFVCIWRDGETLRIVRSHAARETWTQYDPELKERDKLPREQRKGLSRPRGG